MTLLTLKHCLFCFKINDGLTRNTEICHRFCSLVSRYLFKDLNHFHQEKTIKTKFSVNITHACDECAPVLESFCLLYEELQQLKLKLNGRLTEIVSILVNSEDRGADHRKILAEKLTNLGSSIEAISNFRSSLTKTVQIKVEKSFPHLKLKKITDPPPNPSQSLSSHSFSELDENSQEDSESDDEDLFTPVRVKKLKTCTSKLVKKEESLGSVPSHKNEATPTPEPLIPSQEEGTKTNVKVRRRRRRHHKKNLWPNYYRLHCIMCNYSFQSSNILEHHMRQHTRERPFYCTICNKSCTSQSNLRDHKKAHTEQKSYRCKHCGKSLKRKSSLIRHLRLHTDGPTYQCVFCYTKCVSAHTLLLHMICHTNEKPYHCNLCDIPFARKLSLQRHNLQAHVRKVNTPPTTPTRVKKRKAHLGRVKKELPESWPASPENTVKTESSALHSLCARIY